MQEIADKAGINKALLHYYFGNKDQLFMSVFPYTARHMIAFMMPRMRENRRFKAFMDERKEFATDFILNSLKQRKK